MCFLFWVLSGLYFLENGLDWTVWTAGKEEEEQYRRLPLVFGRRPPLLETTGKLASPPRVSSAVYNMGEIRNKPSVRASLAQEASYFVFILWCHSLVLLSASRSRSFSPQETHYGRGTGLPSEKFGVLQIER
jgi:hypothetical protein